MPTDRIRREKLAQAAHGASRRESVLRRLSYRDWSEDELRASLDWPSGTGVGAVLRELRERGEAHDVDGRWRAGPRPTQPETPMDLAQRLGDLVAKRPGMNATGLAKELGVHTARIGQVAERAGVRAEKQGDHRGAPTLYYPITSSPSPAEVTPDREAAPASGGDLLVRVLHHEADAYDPRRHECSATEQVERLEAECVALRRCVADAEAKAERYLASNRLLEQDLRDLRLEVDVANARADRAGHHAAQFGALLDRYDVPSSLRLSYVETALLHRSRCSTWLAQIDHALGSECDRTQAASPEGDEAQAWRLGTIAALRPTNHESEDL